MTHSEEIEALGIKQDLLQTRSHTPHFLPRSPRTHLVTKNQVAGGVRGRRVSAFMASLPSDKTKRVMASMLFVCVFPEQEDSVLCFSALSSGAAWLCGGQPSLLGSPVGVWRVPHLSEAQFPCLGNGTDCQATP